MFNPTHLHLMVTHLPIIGSIITLLVLLYAVYAKNDEFINLCYFLYIIIGIVSIAVYLTGDPSAEAVKNLPGTRVASIEEHENYALISLLFYIFIGVFSALAVYLKKYKNNSPAWIKYTVIILSFFSVISIGLTANSGGEIRHSEISNTL